VKAAVEVYWRGERTKVIDSHEIRVAECLEGDIDARSRGRDLGVVAIGEAGKVWAHGSVMNLVVISGQPVTCRLHLKNNSLRKVSSLIPATN
jgi:hypothetical protein